MMSGSTACCCWIGMPRGAVRWEITDDDGPDMSEYGTIRDRMLTDLVGDTVTQISDGVGSGAAATLGVLNVRYVVLLQPDPELQTALSGQVDLDPLSSEAAVTYQVRTWLPRAGLLGEAQADRLLATGDPGPTVPAQITLPQARPGRYESDNLDSGRGLLVVSESRSSAWRAVAGGQELQQVEIGGDQCLPGRRDHVRVRRRRGRRPSSPDRRRRPDPDRSGCALTRGPAARRQGPGRAGDLDAHRAGWHRRRDHIVCAHRSRLATTAGGQMSTEVTMGAGADRIPGRRRGWLFLLLALALAAALTVGTAVLPDRADSEDGADVAVGEVDVAASGTAYCPVTGADGDAAALEIASTSADQDSEITITRFVDGVPQIDEPRLLEAGRSSLIEIPTGQLRTPVTVDWRGAPVVAQYRLTDASERSVATCQTRPSDRWHLSGFDTNRGNTSTIFLFNPFESDAIVTLRFGTTDGRVDLIIADELLIPAAARLRCGTWRSSVPRPPILRSPSRHRPAVSSHKGRSSVARRARGSRRSPVGTCYRPSRRPRRRCTSPTRRWIPVRTPGSPSTTRGDRAAAAQISVSTPLATTAGDR